VRSVINVAAKKCQFCFPCHMPQRCLILCGGGGGGAGRKTMVTGSRIYNARKHFLPASEILTNIMKNIWIIFHLYRHNILRKFAYAHSPFLRA
jgi:hypothetical protein